MKNELNLSDNLNGNSSVAANFGVFTIVKSLMKKNYSEMTYMIFSPQINKISNSTCCHIYIQCTTLLKITNGNATNKLNDMHLKQYFEHSFTN